MFKAGDRVKVIDYPDDSVQIGSEGIIKGVEDKSKYFWRVILDDFEDDGYGFLFKPNELELIPEEQPYDPTQAGDKDDDI